MRGGRGVDERSAARARVATARAKSLAWPTNAWPREDGSEPYRPEDVEPLLDHFNNSGCVGSVSEIFDGDEPQMPRGCFAQAWSVAELLRAYKMVADW